MTLQHTHTLSLQGIPDIARPVIIAPKEDATRDGEGDGSDGAENIVVLEGVEFAIRSNIEETA